MEVDVSLRAQAGEQPTPDDYRNVLSEEELSRLSEIFETGSTGTNALAPTWIQRGSAIPAVQRDRIGRYKVLGILGQGAYGTVYRAFDDGPLAREVAIKVPRLGDALDQERIASLLKEAGAAAMLSHQNIVTVLDCGELEDGGCFVVFELIKSGHLGQEIINGPLSVDRAVDLMIQISEGVHHAHQHDLFHRDLKPANILIAPNGRPLIADFGLAITDERQYERRGEVLGTAAYMSPEQARGESHLLDGRSDVWALGVILYEMLCGKRPFKGTTHEQLFEAIERQDPRPLRQIDDTIPRDLERICLTCLDRDPAGRFSTALDLRTALQRISERRITVAADEAGPGLIATATHDPKLRNAPVPPERRQSVAKTNVVKKPSRRKRFSLHFW